MQGGDADELLRLIIDALPYHVFWKDRDSTYCGCNDIFCKSTEFASVNEIVGQSDFEMPWTRAEAEFYRACDRQTMEEGQPQIGIVESQTPPNGELIWLETSKIPLKNQDGEVLGILGMYHDITEQKQGEQELKKSHSELSQFNDELEATILERTKQLQYLAQHDSLTDLVNRSFFVSQLNIDLMRKDNHIALLFIDLDRFKSVNDSFGHVVGDKLLVRVAEVLKQSVRKDDVVSRFGGDEFTILMRNVRNLSLIHI